MPAPNEFTLLCERCGYEIDSLPRDEECPECGKPIAESLPERRAGTPWQHEQNWGALLRTGWMTIRSPFATLDRMKPDEDLGQKQANWLGLLAGAIASIPVFLALALAKSLIFILVAPVIMLFVCSFVTPAFELLTYIEVRGIQYFASRRGGRLTSAMAWSICGHGCIGWVVVAIGVSIGASTQIVSIAIAQHGGLEHVPSSFVVVASIGGTLLLLGFLAGFLFFETFAWLGVRRCKFANRARPNHPEQHTTPAPNDQTPANGPS